MTAPISTNSIPTETIDQTPAILAQMQSSRTALLLLTDNLTGTRMALQQAGLLRREDDLLGLIFRITGASHAAIRDLRARESAVLASLPTELA